MKRLNKKGFTLVELLAVIVVLALVMVLTVPTVLDQMNSARQSTFVLYAEEMIKQAQTRYQSDLLMGGVPTTCYTFDDLAGSGNSQKQYKGKIMVTNVNAANLEFKVVMYDNNYMLGYDQAGAKTLAQVEEIRSNLKTTQLPVLDTTKATAASVKCS